jgi:uncharacterized protein (TIGR00297 family)
LVLPPLEAGIGIGLTAILAALAVLGRALTPWAGVVAAGFGSIIVVTVGFAFLGLLVLFVVTSVLATRYRFKVKESLNLQEGRHGERGISNVLAHILIPTGLALATLDSTILPMTTFAVLYTAALAFGAADTFASEFGVLSGRAFSILTLKPVAVGTNGGVSARGELWAVVGAVTSAVVSLGLCVAFGVSTLSYALFVAAAATAGFLACQVDSVLGEVFENRGYLTKGTTNFAAMLSAVALGVGFLAVGGAL